MTQSGGVSRIHAKSGRQKAVFALLHAALIAICVWIALRAGLPDRSRALLLAGVAGLYFLRHMLTLFVLLKRKVAWGEVLGLSGFMALFEIGFLLLGAGLLRGAAVPFGPWDGVALALILAGSALNSGSELQRMIWKRDPANRGHCYTGGLFRYSAHINYFGDTVLFTGWALLTASPWAFAVPLFMGLSFVFYHIPALDAYLAERYGDEFRGYAARTARFVPFLY